MSAADAVVFDGLDGKVYLNDQGLTFKRTRMRSTGRGVGTVHSVPWSAVRAARVEKNSLRVSVAGYDQPRMSTADPHAVDARRGQVDAAASFADLVNQRAAGSDAQPTFVGAPPPAAVPMGPAVPQGTTDLYDRKWFQRFEAFAMFTSGVGLILFGLASLAFFVIVAVLAFVLLTG